MIRASHDFYSALDGLAAADVPSIKEKANFYSFDQQRAREEMAYRQAMIKELGDIESDQNRMTALPKGNL